MKDLTQLQKIQKLLINITRESENIQELIILDEYDGEYTETLETENKLKTVLKTLEYIYSECTNELPF